MCICHWATFTNLLLGAVIKVISGSRSLWISVTPGWLIPCNQRGEKEPPGVQSHAGEIHSEDGDKVVDKSLCHARIPKRYREMPADKFVTIYNGFDQEDFDNLGQQSRGWQDVSVRLHRRLYGKGPEGFLQALNMAVSREPKMRENTRAVFVGSCEEFLDGKRIENYIEEYALQDLVV